MTKRCKATLTSCAGLEAWRGTNREVAVGCVGGTAALVEVGGGRGAFTGERSVAPAVSSSEEESDDGEVAACPGKVVTAVLEVLASAGVRLCSDTPGV